jgi:hypothetical protein
MFATTLSGGSRSWSLLSVLRRDTGLLVTVALRKCLGRSRRAGRKDPPGDEDADHGKASTESALQNCLCRHEVRARGQNIVENDNPLGHWLALTLVDLKTLGELRDVATLFCFVKCSTTLALENQLPNRCCRTRERLADNLQHPIIIEWIGPSLRRWHRNDDDSIPTVRL